ncbi:hypothetical protein VNO78_03535 [Psophocarpus tetragonolobus]|uniref:Bidirectional sugar transporter SWEET n=1 Tax=Psophocarpus tetragonolobus TaxID=3891 RepID=A0AAN9T1P4_PSOTE
MPSTHEKPSISICTPKQLLHTIRQRTKQNGIQTACVTLHTAYFILHTSYRRRERRADAALHLHTLRIYIDCSVGYSKSKSFPSDCILGLVENKISDVEIAELGMRKMVFGSRFVYKCKELLQTISFDQRLHETEGVDLEETNLRITMASHNPSAATFGILGNVVSLMVYLAPVPTFYRIYKKKSTEGFQSLPYLVALFSSSLWLYYALLKIHESIPLITINSLGCVIETIYIVTYITYAHKDAKARVIKTKSVQYMPFNLSFFLTLNAIMWLAYGIFNKDKCVAYPNIGGLGLGLLQMVLYWIYRNGGEKEKEKEKEKEQGALEGVINIVVVNPVGPAEVFPLPIADNNKGGDQ